MNVTRHALHAPSQSSVRRARPWIAPGCGPDATGAGWPRSATPAMGITPGRRQQRWLKRRWRWSRPLRREVPPEQLSTMEQKDVDQLLVPSIMWDH